MTDKLPTIYLPLFDGNIDTSDSEPEMVRAFARKADALIEHPGGEIATYEPAVPRCRTCKFFEQEVDRDQELGDGRFLRPGGNCTRHAFERIGLQRNAGSPMPGDGSGYCSEHQEARR